MINEEVTRQVIAVKKKVLHLTAREVVKLIKMLLNKAEQEKNGLKDFIDKQKPTTVKDLVKKGIEKGELIEADPEVLASELFSLACGNLYYKKDNVIDIEKLYKEIDKTFIQFLKK